MCDTSNAMVRMIEAILQRKYPQLEIAATISQREYEQRDAIEADFVISTVRIGEKDKPVVTIAPFPTDYQLDQIGKLVLVDRTRPWMLNKYFDAAHFRVVDSRWISGAVRRAVPAAAGGRLLSMPSFMLR